MVQYNFMKIKNIILVILSVVLSTYCTSSENAFHSNSVPLIQSEITNSALLKSGENKSQILSAIENCKDENKEGLQFLLENMPERDLKNLNEKFLLENLEYSYKVLDSVKWGKRIPKDIFLNYVLPYANLHERRDNWRIDFFNKFLPIVKNLNSTSEAVLKLNEEVWKILNVQYSTKRPKADQSPYETIDAEMASCTGLSILLIDVCRAVGIPARFVGVPLWKDESGNHSWVEIWDDGWHFIGAAEESPLDKTWFGERALTSDDTNWKYSIYANSFKKTDVIFPPLFDSTATYVYADIVTDRYSKQIHNNDSVQFAIRLFDKKDGERIQGKISIKQADKIIASGISKDEKHDYNDFLFFILKPNEEYEIITEAKGKTKKQDVTLDKSKYQFHNIYLTE